jgi:Cu(I)/Ag(I) efflux system membrane fusion protein
MTVTRKRVVRIAALTLVPLIAVLTAVLATRETTTAATPQSHDHSNQAGSDSAQPIMLSRDAAQRIGVTYAAVAEKVLTREIRTVGQIVFDETRVRVIAPKVEGWVEQLFADATGKEISVGTPLMRVYSPMIVAAEEELLLASRLAVQMSGGDSAARANASSLVAAARSRLAAWDLTSEDIDRIERAGRGERTIVVRSPVPGFIVEKNVVQGQRVMAGDVLYKVADLRRVWLEGDVYEQDLPSLRVGQVARAELQALPGSTYNGRVAFVYPTLNTDTRTVRIRVELPNPGYRLKPGMVATLRLVGSTDDRALTVPRPAVLSTGERHLVFVKRADGMLEPRIVTIGRATDERIEILRGVSLGDTVVASATFLLDAESSLGTALGGMGDMPGMDIVAPKKKD